jgi:WD40 repeat protein
VLPGLGSFAGKGEDGMADTESSSYDGFLSYSHAADDLLAPRLQAGLQRFAKPWWKRRALRVFRDEASLTANPHLWSSITDALDDSDWFVLLLSPDAAQSKWVNREIDYWTEHKNPARILPVVTDGTFDWSDGDIAGDAVPPSLQGVFADEPRWVDLRFARTETQLDLRHTRFRDTVADVAAAIRGVPKDELESEEIHQHRRSIRTAWTGGIAILALGVAATVGAIVAYNAQQEAEAEAARAEQLALEMQHRSEVATARELAASSAGVLESDPELATLLAIEAIAAAPDPQKEAVQALHSALQHNRIRTRLPWDSYEGGPGAGLGIATHPEGELVAVSEDGASVDLWTLDGQLVVTLMGGSDSDSIVGGNIGISFNAVGNRLASVDPAGMVMIWEVSSGDLIYSFEGHDFGPGLARFSSDGRWLATVTNIQPPLSCEVVLWDVGTWEEQWRVQMPAYAGQVSFAPDGESLTIGAWVAEENPDHGLAVVYEVPTGAEIFRAVVGPRVSSVGYSHDGAVLGIPMWDGVVRLVSTDTYETIGQLSGGEVQTMAFSPVDSLVAGNGGQGTTVWDYETGRAVLTLPPPANAVAVDHPVFTADGTGLIQHGGIVWDLQAPIGEVLTLVTGGAVDAQFDPSGDRLVVNAGRGDSYRPPGKVTIHDASTGKAILSIPDRYGYYMGINPNGDTIALFGSSGVTLFSLESGQRLLDLPNTGSLPGEYLGGTATFSPDGQTVAAAGDTPFIGIWDARTGKQIGGFIELAERDPATGIFAGATFSVVFTPDGTRLISGEFVSGIVHVIDVVSRNQLATYDHGPGLYGIALSPDGSLLASFSFNGAVKVWNIDSGELVHNLKHPAWVKGASFSPDGSKLAVVDDDGVLTIWNVAAGTQELTVPAHDGWVFSVRWHPDGTHLVTSSDDGTVRVWTLDPNELVDIARARVTRSLTEAECQVYLHIDTCPNS